MKNKHIYLKFFAFIIFCGLLGGLSSILLMNTDDFLVRAFENFQNALFKYTLPITMIATALLFLAGLVFYFKSKAYYKQLQINETDTLYDKIDFCSSIGTTLSNVILIFNFISFGISTSNMGLHDNQTDQTGLAICFFISAMALCIIMQVFFINFTKKLNPEKKGHPLDFNFQKKWLNSSDEAEKYIIYKASFKSFQIMQTIFPILFMLFLLISVILPVGPVPFLIIGVLWIIQTLVYSVYATKYQRNNNFEKDI